MTIFVKKKLQLDAEGVMQQELTCYLIPNTLMILQFLFLMLYYKKLGKFVYLILVKAISD